MAIQSRRGKYSDFDPNRLLPGEWAVVQSGHPDAEDGEAVYMAFSAGSVKRMATHEDVRREIETSTQEIAEELAAEFEADITTDIQAAQTAANDASTAATRASNSAAQAAQSAAAFTVDKTLTVSDKAADAKTVGDELSTLKDDFDNLDTVVFGVKNYIENKRLVTSGTSKGALADDSDYSVSEKIPISLFNTGTIITVDYGAISASALFAIYDDQDALVYSTSLASSDTKKVFTCHYDATKDPTYIRFAFKKGYSGRIANRTDTQTLWAAGATGGFDNDVGEIHTEMDTMSVEIGQNAAQISGMRDGEIDGYRHIQPFINGSFADVSSPSPTLTTGENNRIRPTEFLHFKAGDTIYIANGTGCVHKRSIWSGYIGSAILKGYDSNWVATDRTISPDYDGFMIVVFADATDQTADINPSDFHGSVKITSYAMRSKKEYGHGSRICVMSYNVQWFYGRNANTIMQNAILDKYNPDIIGMQEFRDNVNKIPIWTTLFRDYSYRHYTTEGNTNYKGLASKVPFGTVQAVAFENQGTGETRGYSKTYLDINGKSVCWINTHLDNDETLKVAQAQELFNLVQNETYFILTGDLNTGTCMSTSDTEYTTIMKQFIDAGYHSANCSDQHGFIGTFCGAPTVPEYNDGVMKPIDHIITSANITINQVYADDIKMMGIFVDENNIDHVPLVAYITIS